MHELMFEDDDPVLARVRQIALALPDAQEKVSHEGVQMDRDRPHS